MKETHNGRGFHKSPNFFSKIGRFFLIRKLPLERYEGNKTSQRTACLPSAKGRSEEQGFASDASLFVILSWHKESVKV